MTKKAVRGLAPAVGSAMDASALYGSLIVYTVVVLSIQLYLQ